MFSFGSALRQPVEPGADIIRVGVFALAQAHGVRKLILERRHKRGSSAIFQCFHPPEKIGPLSAEHFGVGLISDRRPVLTDEEIQIPGGMLEEENARCSLRAIRQKNS